MGIYCRVMQRGHIFVVVTLKLVSELVPGHTLFPRSVDDFVVDIGNILQVKNLIPPMTKVAGNKIKLSVGFAVAKVRVIVDGWAADKQIH